MLPGFPPPAAAPQDGEYSVVQLRGAFAGHGVVEDVVLREGKKKKGSALVVMASQEGADSAAAAACGDLANPLLVVPFPKVRLPLPRLAGLAGFFPSACWAF